MLKGAKRNPLLKRPLDCTHINHPEHINNICYSCTSNYQRRLKYNGINFPKSSGKDTVQSPKDIINSTKGMNNFY